MGGKANDHAERAEAPSATGRHPAANAGAALLVSGLFGATAAYGSAFLPGGAPGWAGPTLAVGAVLTMTGTALLAAAREGAGPLTAVLGGGGLLLALAMIALWSIPPADAANPRLVLGLPARAAHLLYGIGLLPALVVPLVYAWSFDRATLSEEDVRRVRAASGSADDHPATTP